MCKIIINVTKPSAQPSQVCIKDYNRKFEHLFNDCCEILASFSKTFSRYIYFNVSLQLLHVYKNLDHKNFRKTISNERFMC